MFWKLKYHTPSAIDGLLEKEDCRLTQILDEDDVLQECKTQNRKLIDFLIEPDKISDLVHYVTVEPSDEMEEKVRFKYPHIACEVLTAEVFSITEKLCEDEKLIRRLWGFLDDDKLLNPLIGSFTCKVLIMLLCQKSSVVFNYVQNCVDFVDRLLCHLNTSAMMDLLLQMVAAPDTDQTRQDLAKWLNDQAVVEKLICYIHPSADPEQCYNASQALCDMLRLSRESAQLSSPAPLLQTLESAKMVELLLKNMFDADTVQDNVVLCGMSFLLMLIDTKRVVTMFTGAFGSVSYSTSDEPLSINLEATCRRTLGALLPRMKDFHNILIRKPKMLPQKSTIGVLDPPLGNTRLQTIHLITAVVEANDIKINQELVNLNTLSILLDLFFQYPWNNFLHAEVELCLNAAFNASTNTSTSTSDTLEQDSPFDARPQKTAETQVVSTILIEHLFTECHLVQKLLNGYARNDEICNRTGGRHQGYMGHLMRIINMLYRHCEETADVLKTLQDCIDTSTCEEWSEFLKGPLLEHNKKCEANLGGQFPPTSSIEESDEEGDPGYGHENDAEKAFSLYQNMRFVNNFIDDFGHTDELCTMEEPISAPFDRLDETSFETPSNFEHTSHTGMFDTVCMERIQQFDDPIPPDDEDPEELDTWTEREMTFDVSNANRTTNTVSDDSSDEEVVGPSMIREIKTARGSSSTSTDSDEDEDEDDEVSNTPPIANSTFYTSLADDHAAPLLLDSEKGSNSPNWSADPNSPLDVKPVPHGAIADWTQEPDESPQDVGWATFGGSDFGDQSSNVTETTQSIVQEGEVPTSHLAEVAQSPPVTEDPANQGYSQLQAEDDQVTSDVTAEQSANEAADDQTSKEDERSAEEHVSVFDDCSKSHEPSTEATNHSIAEADKLTQVPADAGNQVTVHPDAVNHQQTDINNVHSVTSDDGKHLPPVETSEHSPPVETENDEQSLGEKSPDTLYDKKLIVSSNEADESPVLGLRFTNIMNEQSGDKANENSEGDDEDSGDDNLIGDSLDELLTTSRGSKYKVDPQIDSNDAENKDENEDEDLENNFSFLSSGMLHGSLKTGVATNSSQSEKLEKARAEAQEVCQQYTHDTQEDRERSSD